MIDPSNYKLLLTHVYNLLILLIIISITSVIAYYKGFYKVDKKIKVPVSFLQMITGFFIYISVSIGIPLFAKYFNFLHKNSQFSDLNILHFIINFSIICLLIFFALKIKRQTAKDIIKVKYKNSKPIRKDVFLGIFSWIIIFPIIIFTTEFFELLLLVFFNIVDIPDQEAVKYLKIAMSSPINLVIAISSISIFAPIVEEFLFRGLLQNFFKKFLNIKFSIILTSVIFTLFHFAISQGIGNITIIASIFALSIFLGFLYEKQKSLFSPIFLHFTFNSINIINLIYFKGV
jgi:hypothetical protein